jgi:hypothetical protein
MLNINEVNFEMWRTHKIRGTPCPSSLSVFVWNTANQACGALEKRVEGKLKTMTYAERADLRKDLILRFLEFIVDNPTRSIGWCFKTYKMRFSNVMTEIEAKALGLGVKRAAGIQTYELKKLGKQLKENRCGEVHHPILCSLMMEQLPFDDEAMEVTKDGVTVDWELYKVNREGQ